MAEDQVGIEVVATTSDAEQKLQSIGDTTQEAMGRAGEAMSGFSALTVAAGTAIEHFAEEALQKLKEALTDSFEAFEKYGEEVGKMQRVLGGTTESLSVLDTALNAVGISSQTYEGIAARVALRMNTNQKAFEQYGLSVKDSNGNVKDATEMITEITAKLEEYSAGMSRNIVASQLLGRGFISASDLLKLTKDRMDEATAVAHDFGLVLSQEDVDAAEKFSFTTNLLGEALHGIYITIGREVVPVLTDMAEWFLSKGPVVMDATRASVDLLATSFNVLKTIVTSLADVVSTAFGDIRDIINAVMGDGGDAPTAMELFKDTLQVIEVLLVGFRTAFVIAFALVKGQLDSVSISMKTFGAVASAMFHLDWAGVKAAWKSGTDELKAQVDAMTQHIMQEAAKSQSDIANIMAGGASPGASKVGGGAIGGKSASLSSKNKGTGDTRLAQWKDELKQRLEAEQDYFKTSLDEDEAFWQQKLALVTGHSKQDLALRRAINSELYAIHKEQAIQAKQLQQEQIAYSQEQAKAEAALQAEYVKEEQALLDDEYNHGLISTKDYYAAKLGLEMTGINASIAAKQKELAAAQQRVGVDPRDALKIQMEQAKIAGEINVLEAQRNNLVSKNTVEYQNAEAARLSAMQMTQANEAKNAADADILQQENKNKQLEALRIIDAQTAFDLQKQTEDQSYDATVAFLQKKLQAELLTTKNIEQTQANSALAMEQAEQQHQLKLTQIENAAVLQRKQYALQADQTVQNSFETMTFDMMDGAKKWSDIFRNFALSVAQAFEKLIAQKLAEKIFGSGTTIGNIVDNFTKTVTDGLDRILGTTISNEAAQTAAVETGTAQRMAASEAAAGQSIFQSAWSAIKNIMNYAAETFAAIYKALAGIPFIGPFLAPAAAASGMAVVAGVAGSVASSAGGDWKVDQDRLNIVHANETILPAGVADTMRSFFAGGSQSGGSSNVNFNVQAIDAAGVKKFFMDNGQHIATALTAQARNFTPVKV